MKLHVPFYSLTLLRKVRVLDYAKTNSLSGKPPGVYLFTDMERMDEQAKKRAIELYEVLSKEPKKYRLLNHPEKSLKRYELLRRLYQEGKNDFTVHRYCDMPASIRFPAFLRHEHKHTGPLSEPLKNLDELQGRAEYLFSKGISKKTLLITEYLEAQEPDGIYRKYGAFRFGDHIIPRHMYTGLDWCLKQGTNNKRSRYIQEELSYVRENPHKDELYKNISTGQP